MILDDVIWHLKNFVDGAIIAETDESEAKIFSRSVWIAFSSNSHNVAELGEIFHQDVVAEVLNDTADHDRSATIDVLVWVTLDLDFVNRN